MPVYFTHYENGRREKSISPILYGSYRRTKRRRHDFYKQAGRNGTVRNVQEITVV